VFYLLVVLVKFQYLPSDWLERLFTNRGLQKAEAEECYDFLGLFQLTSAVLL